MTSNLRQTPLTCSGHTRPVVFLTFSDFNPSDSGNYYCISACKDGKPMLRQGDTGDWIGTFEGHKGAVWGVDLNGNATMAATGAADFSAKVWDAVKGDEILNLNHNHIVKSVNFSSDSKLLATASNDKKLRIFDISAAPEGEEAEDRKPTVVFDGHKSGIKQVLFSSDDKMLLSCSDDKTLRYWDVSSGKEVKSVEFPSQISGMELSQDGETITLTLGNSVCFFNAKSLEKEKEVNLPCAVYTASFLKDRKVFVCGGEDMKLYKYSYETGEEIESFKGHFGPVHCVRFSPDGELYASGSEDGTLRLWQTEVGKTYGLWKCVDTPALDTMATKPEAVSS